MNQNLPGMPPQTKPKPPLTLREMIRQSVENDPLLAQDRESFRRKGWDYPYPAGKRRRL